MNGNVMLETRHETHLYGISLLIKIGDVCIQLKMQISEVVSSTQL